MHLISTSLRTTAGSALAAILLVLPQAAAAGSALGQAKAVAGGAGLGTKGSAADIVGSLINAVLGLVGVIFFGLMIYAGFMWMTAGGNEEKVTKAKKTLVSSIVGLVIVMMAYAISIFVVDKIIGATT